MPLFLRRYFFVFLPAVLLITATPVFAQEGSGKPSGKPADSLKKSNPGSSFNNRFGKYDTIWSMVIVYEGDTIPAKTYAAVDVWHLMSKAMRKRLEGLTRLRNAVYVTYPYARRAGIILNDMNAHLSGLNSESQKKEYIKSKEKELKKQFSEPIEKLSVYQGKVLMKLINRQTGNNCYDIIKEYRGSFSARVWQTVAFFFGSSLKQPYDAQGDDHDIEIIVQEVERMYRG